MKDLDSLSKEEKIALLTALEEKNDRIRFNKFATFFPDTGPHSRDNYTKHLEFFAAGKEYKERAFIGGNRVGKSISGLYELTCHLTGEYPKWWEGRRFNHAINAVASGKTNESTRNIIQEGLLGSRTEPGTGMIPKILSNGKEAIQRITSRQGVADAVLDIYVNNINGGTSHLILKSDEQGRGAFEGISVHVAWLDEEPELKDQDIYDEILVRTATTDGIVFCTFTPLEGLSDIVLSYLPGGICPENGVVNKFKYVTMVGWDDVPHKIDKEAIAASCRPHDIEARSKGIPSVGEGKIYPLPESHIVVEPFMIPPTWAKAYGLDPGWQTTAAIWGAIDPNSGTVYVYDEYYRGQAEPAVHIAAIKTRGAWMYGAIDYAGVNQADGSRLMAQYTEQGLNVIKANKAVDAGLLKCYTLMSEGKLKVFSTCQNWLKEFRIYRYNKLGHVHKEHDHLMDAMRYLIMSGLNLAEPTPTDSYFNRSQGSINTFGLDSVTGY